MTKQEEIIVIKSYHSSAQKKARIINTEVKQLKEEYDLLIKEIIQKSFSSEVTPEEVSKVLSSGKIIQSMEESSSQLIDNLNLTKSSSQRLSESEKKKLYYYNKTGDFTQAEIADIFGTTQATVSRIIKKIDEEENNNE